MIFLAIAAMALTATNQDIAAARPAREKGSQIIVTGTPLAATERALKACLARHCPPAEDIEATLAHAENLFVAGRYRDALQTTHASLGRNHGFAHDLPVPVSDLYRADSRIAIHLGEGTEYYDSTWGIRRALKAGLPASDRRIVGADLEIADMYASLARTDDAHRAYQGVEKEAEAIGRPDLAGIARVREAWLDELTGDRPAAVAALRRIAADRAPAARAARFSALILLARLDRQEGRQASSNALIGELRDAGFARPVLLFAPQIEMPASRLLSGNAFPHGGTISPTGETSSVTRLMATEDFEDRWVDIGFWVTQDGKVDDPEILRSHGNSDWSKGLLRSVAGRIYSPVTGAEGNYRVERYSFTSLQRVGTESRMRQRSPDARIEFVDLTDEPATARN